MQVSAQTEPGNADFLSEAAPPCPDFTAAFCPDDRDVTVYLPPGYEENADRSYPVLYMNDGQNLFESETSSAKERSWQLAKTADAAIQSREIEPLLIVGIANAGDRRLAEYTPTHDWKLGGGEADKYGRLLTEELLPFIAANYRIRPGAANTGAGRLASLGEGCAALYALGLKYENIFRKLAVLSPSIWWNHRAILSLVSEAVPKLRAKPRLWLDVGDAEGQRTVADVDLLDRRLRAKGWRPGR